MSSDILAMLGGFVFAMLVYTLLGRTICKTTASDRLMMSTGLYYVLTGMGVWYLSFLVALYFDQYMIKPLWWAFVLAVIAFFIFSLKDRGKEKVGEHFFTQIFVAVLFLAPTFSLLLADTPQLESEFSGVVRQLHYIMYRGHLPPVAEGVEASLNMFADAPAYLATILPTNMITNLYSPAVFSVFNAFLFVLASEAMSRVSGVQVRWSNLPLVAVASLICLTLFNPFFDTSYITSANTNLLYATVLFSAVLPLLRESGVPVGVKSIAPALILSLLVSLNNMGIVMAALIFIAYSIRLIISRVGINLEVIFALFVMLVLPVFSWLLWQGESYGAALSGYHDDVSRWGLLDGSSPLLVWTWASASILMLVLGIAVAQFFDKLVRQNLNAYMWLFVPAFVAFSYVGIGVFLKQEVQLAHLQFILLVPIWRWALWWYEATPLKKLAYQYPWGIGLGLALLFIVFQSVYKVEMKERYDDAMLHTFNVGRMIATEHMNDETLAVLDVPNREAYTLSLLRYALSEKGGSVVGVSGALYETVADVTLFHKRLMRANVGWLWIHAPMGIHSEMLGQKLDKRASYLFQVNERGLKLIRKLKHPNYDSTMLAKACEEAGCRLGAWLKQ